MPTPDSSVPETPKEGIYDEKINGLVAEITKLCVEHHINVSMTFCLEFSPEKGMLMTTTTIPADPSDSKGMDMIAALHGVAYGQLDVVRSPGSRPPN